VQGWLRASTRRERIELQDFMFMNDMFINGVGAVIQSQYR
jgi:hypothetical protein